MKNLLLFVLFVQLTTFTTLYAQKHTISGTVKDVASGESLIGASIFNIKNTQGTTTNAFGFYSITLSGDSVSLRFSYVGYQTSTTNFFLKKDTIINLELASAVLQE